jgi:phosphatidylserine/phosphatidylglycerophosphate/cardiolipin synthase-like enzyme
VRILLDSYFDDLGSSRSNLRTEEYLAAVARAEGLDLQARRGNPTGLGLHNKMVLAEVDGRGWAMVGSLNGGEASAKVNREVSLVVQSDEAYRYLAVMFWGDWGQ